jgi:hypothetical protein
MLDRTLPAPSSRLIIQPDGADCLGRNVTQPRNVNVVQ